MDKLNEKPVEKSIESEAIAVNKTHSAMCSTGDTVVVDDGNVVITQLAPATLEEIAFWLDDEEAWK